MRTWALLWLGVGCGDPGSSPDAPIDVSIDVRPLGTLTGRGTVKEWVSPTTFGAPIQAARVCLRDAIPEHCVTTGALGDWTLDLIPESRSVGLAFEKAGHVRTLLLSKSGVGNFAGFVSSMITDAIAQQKMQDAGGTFPLAGTAIVEVTVVARPSPSGAPRLAGATVTMTPASGIGPVYLGQDGYPDPSLDATSAEGGVMFVNVAPGMVQLTVTVPGKTCVTPDDGWPAWSPNAVLLPAEPDTLSHSYVFCD